MGFEQRAKSERIWAIALLPGVPQSEGLDTITRSLIAKSAHAAAQSGVASLSLSPHAVFDAWIIALQSTVVV